MADRQFEKYLTKPQRIWLAAVYEKFKMGEPANARLLSVELRGKLPRDFDPREINTHLLRSGINITILGIALLDPDSDLVRSTDRVIRDIQERLVNNPDIKTIGAAEISQSTALQEYDVAVILEMLSFTSLFHGSGTSYGQKGWATFNVEDRAFDQYLKYEGMEQLLEGIIGAGRTHNAQLAGGKDIVSLIPAEEAEARKVFVVHGHDDLVKTEVTLLLERLKLKPVILHEQTSRGLTIIEKFEAYASVSYAVVLLTPDDVGGKSPDGLKARARQNVVFELGYFYGKLGRKHVCCLHKGGVEIPSDNAGVIYISYDTNGGWKLNLARELAEVFEIDMRLLR